MSSIERVRRLHLRKRDTKLAESIIRSAIGSIGGLSNVTEYQITWNKRHGNPNDLSLVTAGRLAFGEDLRRLSICCPIELISSILPASITLGKLRELKIECPANIIRLLEYLAVRINSLLTTFPLVGCVGFIRNTPIRCIAFLPFLSHPSSTGSHGPHSL